MMKTNNLLRALLGLALSLSFAAAHAQYPERPIVLVTPYAPGGGSDATARAIAEGLSRELKQSIVVDNKPGGNGSVGAMDVINARPDGYRLLLSAAGGLTIDNAMRLKPPFDPVKDLTPIAGALEASMFVYVNPALPVKNLADLIELGRKNPGKYSYATASGTSMLLGKYLFRKASVDLLQVSYKSEAAAVVDVMAGRVDAMVATYWPTEMVKQGKLRALVTMPARSEILPDVPALRETEYGKDLPAPWFALLGPANLPKDVTDKLSRAFLAVARDPQYKAKFTGMGLTPRLLDSAAFTTYLQDDRDFYVKLVKDAGIPRE